MVGVFSGDSKGWREKLLFSQFYPENCMKMKEIRPRKGSRIPESTHLGFANTMYTFALLDLKENY